MDLREKTKLKVRRRVWDISKAGLARLRYSNLEDLFYGILNLDIPDEMTDRMNADEIVSKYIGATQLKRGNRHHLNHMPRDFSQLLRKLDITAYPLIAVSVRDWEKRFSHNPGDQRRRLAELEYDIQAMFIDSFFKSYRPSMREQPSNPEAFYDPNADGRDARVYVNRIYEMLRERQVRNNGL